mgnify:CR=1 FL=1
MGKWKLAECGTRSAYNRHLRYKEPACEACLKAQRDYIRKWCKNNPDKFKVIYTRNNKKQYEKRKAAKSAEAVAE